MARKGNKPSKIHVGRHRGGNELKDNERSEEDDETADSTKLSDQDTVRHGSSLQVNLNYYQNEPLFQQYTTPAEMELEAVVRRAAKKPLLSTYYSLPVAEDEYSVALKYKGSGFQWNRKRTNANPTVFLGIVRDSSGTSRYWTIVRGKRRFKEDNWDSVPSSNLSCGSLASIKGLLAFMTDKTTLGELHATFKGDVVYDGTDPFEPFGELEGAVSTKGGFIVPTPSKPMRISVYLSRPGRNANAITPRIRVVHCYPHMEGCYYEPIHNLDIVEEEGTTMRNSTDECIFVLGASPGKGVLTRERVDMLQIKRKPNEYSKFITLASGSVSFPMAGTLIAGSRSKCGIVRGLARTFPGFMDAASLLGLAVILMEVFATIFVHTMASIHPWWVAYPCLAAWTIWHLFANVVGRYFGILVGLGLSTHFEELGLAALVSIQTCLMFFGGWGVASTGGEIPTSAGDEEKSEVLFAEMCSKLLLLIVPLAEPLLIICCYIYYSCDTPMKWEGSWIPSWVVSFVNGVDPSWWLMRHGVSLNYLGLGRGGEKLLRTITGSREMYSVKHLLAPMPPRIPQFLAGPPNLGRGATAEQEQLESGNLSPQPKDWVDLLVKRAELYDKQSRLKQTLAMKEDDMDLPKWVHHAFKDPGEESGETRWFSSEWITIPAGGIFSEEKWVAMTTVPGLPTPGSESRRRKVFVIDDPVRPVIKVADAKEISRDDPVPILISKMELFDLLARGLGDGLMVMQPIRQRNLVYDYGKGARRSYKWSQILAVAVPFVGSIVLSVKTWQTVGLSHFRDFLALFSSEKPFFDKRSLLDGLGVLAWILRAVLAIVYMCNSTGRGAGRLPWTLDPTREGCCHLAAGGRRVLGTYRLMWAEEKLPNGLVVHRETRDHGLSEPYVVTFTKACVRGETIVSVG